MKLDLNELNKIIDDSLCRKNRGPLVYSKELLIRLSKIKPSQYKRSEYVTQSSQINNYLNNI